jgi:hypothetical protein
MIFVTVAGERPSESTARVTWAADLPAMANTKHSQIARSSTYVRSEVCLRSTR